MTVAELLNIEKIADLIADKSPQEQIILLAELKQEAAKMKLVREFNSAVAVAKDTLMRREIGKPLADIPECITDTAGYSMQELGIFLQLKNSELEICPFPIFPIERYADIDDGTEKIKLKFKRDNAWHEIIVSRSTIANSNKIIQLADSATGINSENARGIVKYLSDIESANRYNIPLKRSVGRLGWTDYGFVPFIDDINFTGAETYAPIYNKFHTKGDFKVWRNLSIDTLKFSIPRIITAASYASLLLKNIGVNGFCVHLWGESGRGKTVALMLGASIYGDADPKSGIIRNGKTTSNGIEPVLGFFNDCAVFFDELTTLSQEQITDMVYKFAQGQGKGRMTKNAGLQKTYTWNNVAILSAEKPLTDNRTMSGAINRIISIYSENEVFDYMDMVKIANILKENYGFGAKLFIEALKNIDIYEIYSRYIKSIPENVEQKQANAAAVILTAYEIAAKYVYNIDDYMTISELLPYLATKTDVSVSLRAYESVQEWVAANYTYFDESEINQSKWGSITDKYIHIFSARFADWCDKNGYHEQAILREWRTRGLIKCRSENEFKNNAKVKGILRSDVISVVRSYKHIDLVEIQGNVDDFPF